MVKHAPIYSEITLRFLLSVVSVMMAVNCAKRLTRSPAVAEKADCTEYNVRYSYRPLSEIVKGSLSIYLFTV